MGCDIINLNILSFCVVSVHNVVLFQSQSHLSRVHIYWDKEIRITMPSKGLTVHYSSIDRQNIWESPNKSAILEKTKSSFLPFFFSLLIPVRGHLRKCQQNCHVIKQSDINGGSQAEGDGSNTLRWLAWARRCNYAPLLHPAFDVVCGVVKALTGQTLNISAICQIIFAFQSEGY